MKWKLLKTREKYYYIVWLVCKFLVKPFYWLGNLSVDKLNKSYYKNIK